MSSSTVQHAVFCDFVLSRNTSNDTKVDKR